MYRLDDTRRFWDEIWQEAIPDSYTMDIGNTGATASLSGYVPSEHFALAIASILGFTTVVDNVLYRLAPVCHPRARNLYASSVKVSPYALKKAGDDSQPWLYEPSPSTKSVFTNPMYPLESHNVTLRTSRYEMLKIDIDFSEFVGVTFASNDQPDFQDRYFNKEFLRYTSVTFEPSLDVLQMDNMASLVFDAGPLENEAFPTPVGVFLPQAKVKLTWMWVPHEFLAETPALGKIPYRDMIHSKLSHVNEREFLGFEPGTLLFTGWQTEPILLPYPDDSANCVIMNLAWNVTFDFTFVGTSAADYYLGTPDWRTRGHNVFPCREDRNFYPASIRDESDGVSSGAPLYPATDFSEIFRTVRS